MSEQQVEQERHDIRQEIERARHGIAEKTLELTERAAAAGRKLSPSHQIQERPFVMLAVAVGTGFVAQRVLFGRPKVYMMAARRDEKDEVRAEPREEETSREEGKDAGGMSAPMQALLAVAQGTAVSLAHQVLGKLLQPSQEPSG